MFTIYTIGGGEFMRDFFNGVAVLVNSNIYATAFKIMIVIGVIWHGFRASNGALKESIKWVLTTVLILYIMIFAKATLIVEDRINPTLSGNRIDNVPFGLAVIAGISSALDKNLTAGFEQMFSLPNDLQYSENGLILGAKIVKQTAFAELAQDRANEIQQRFKANFQEFIEACVIVNAQQGVPYNESQLKTSDNLWSLISNKDGLSPIFTFKYTYANNSSGFLMR
jgi:conjugal transfer mating pair stabilization protein TraG